MDEDDENRKIGGARPDRLGRKEGG